MKNFKRAFIIILDSAGIGALPDAATYGDEGANTIGHIAQAKGGLQMPTMQAMGLGNIAPVEGVTPQTQTNAYYTKMAELSVGKDTMTGHWEFMGLHITEPFQVFTDTGFPKALLDELSAQTGYEFIGNYSASGTEILDDLGEEHMATKKLIVYTSADSVLQIAAHEDIVPIDELWRICKIAREITMKEEWKVGRIIARPFVGTGKGHFQRTPNRHDYALKPFDKTVMNFLEESGYDVISLGKIADIYDGEGVTHAIKTKSNDDGMAKIVEVAKSDFNGLAYLNLVDFDAVYGHRRNAVGYGDALETFDAQLPELLETLTADDLLFITADHGNDPTAPGSDHTREYVPLVVYSKAFTAPKALPVRQSFADLGATIAQIFDVQSPEIGTSFADELE
ncbi:MAG: phosphopentomutase [Culicoidibacterales bacterium]